MHEYYCKKCRGLFESSIVQSRCPTDKCQSRQIKDINTPYQMHRPKIYNNAFFDIGKEYDTYRDEQGRFIRNQIQKLIEEEKPNE